MRQVSDELDRLEQDYDNAIECNSDDYLLIWDAWVALKEEEEEEPQCDPS